MQYQGGNKKLPRTRKQILAGRQENDPQVEDKACESISFGRWTEHATAGTSVSKFSVQDAAYTTTRGSQEGGGAQVSWKLERKSSTLPLYLRENLFSTFI